MKWLLFTAAVGCLAGFANAGALKCTPASSDPVCLEKDIQVTEESVQSVWQPAVPESQRECAPGSEWVSRCHRCWCSGAGVADCQKLTDCQDAELGLEPVHCKPNSTLRRGCNTCVCLESGLGLCTLNICKEKPVAVPSPAPVSSPAPPVQGMECLPESTWRSQCNDCKCTTDGRAVCTENKCSGFEKESPKTCAPESAWKNDCNSCWCTEDGRAMCTKMGCITGVIMNFDDDDNDSEAKQEASDKKAEKLDLNTSLARKVRAIPPTETPKTCLPGQEFRMDCNKCLCDNKGQDFSCTRINCLATQANSNVGSRRKREVSQQEVAKCSPGEVFDQGCNVCRCTSDGHHATCTLNRCSPKPEEEKKEDESSNLTEGDPNFRCNPGEQFKRGCNDCTCSADGKSVFCTLRYCDKDLTPRL
ncbi:uncharacterized protein LOC105383426 isoform X4 [Plutella xylostella]|uniref:uncharacterized protein LOC105383426 isoform X4 n=1 Tax=Plutella xylostella TaxID=51655 RepID=UPI002032F80D|nr:uncharacterized protein LOC105383426 isoform X4 [Plutella xylostella]